MIRTTLTKKAQLTMFFIIGLLLFLFVGVLLFTSFISKMNAPKTIPAQEVEESYLAVKNAIKACERTVGIDALKYIGKHGGYYDLSKLHYFEDVPSKSNALEVLNNKVALWVYSPSSVTCKQCELKFAAPSLQDIEGEISKYVQDHLKTCIDDVAKNFKETKGYEISLASKTLDVSTKITKKDVVISLDTPVNVKYNGEERTLSKISEKLGYDFARIYYAAYDLAEQQYFYGRLNDLTYSWLLDLTSLDIDKSLIPPPTFTSDSSFGFTPKFVYWFLSDVKDIVKGHFATSIQEVRVSGTLNDQRYLEDDEKYKLFLSETLDYYDRRTIPFTYSKDYYHNLSINFYYLPNFWFDLAVNSGSELLMPITRKVFPPENLPPIFDIVPALYLYKYIFFYSYSFPVLVNIRDPNAFNGQGYTFNFGLEINVRQSQSLDSAFASIESGDQIRADLFCSPKNYQSAEQTFVVKDALTGKPLEDVAVSFQCFDISCPLGLTKKENELSFSTLKSSLPICPGGQVTFYKDGYRKTTLTIPSNFDAPHTYYIDMWPFKELNVRVYKRLVTLAHRENVINSSFVADTFSEIPLTRDEKAIVIFEEPTLGLSDVAIINSNEEGAKKTLKLVPGNYTINIVLIKNVSHFNNGQGIVIQPQEYCSSGFLGIFGKECTNVPEDPIKFNETIVVGMLDFYNISGHSFEITADDLYNSNTIEVFVPAFDPSWISTVGDLTVFSYLEDVVKSNESAFIPRFTTHGANS